MEEFTIFIEERLVRAVTVKAEDSDEAMEMVREMYENEEIVLTADDYFDTEFDFDILNN